MEFWSREEWAKIMPKDLWKSNCPFCKIRDLEIWRWKYWFICHNKFPICWSKKHLMAIPLRHVIYTKDLTTQEWSEFKKVEEYMFNIYKWWHYFSFIRENTESRSLEHLHYHFLPAAMQYDHLEKIMLNQTKTPINN